MRSKNTDTYESQNRSFQYTMLAVIGVLLAVGIIAYAVRSLPGFRTEPQNPVDMNPVDVNPLPNLGETEDLPEVDVSKTVPSVDSRSQQQGSGQKVQDEGGTANYGFSMPVEGTVIKEFSAETPVYSKTLEQYVTHLGVDFEAPADAQVRAVDGGTVTAVYEDDSLGVTIEITHGDGYVSRYSNLSTAQMVEENDVVERGQAISGVGNSALFETLDPEHLHFELWKDGNPVDPAEYL